MRRFVKRKTGMDRIRRSTLGWLLSGAVLLAPGAGIAGGFESTATIGFKLNAAGMNVSREQMRQNLNASSSGSGSVAAQTQSNMSNVVQITENYDIVLNGSGNTVNSGGGYSGQQASTGSKQTTDNQINTQSTLSTLGTGSASTTGTVLNP